MVIFWRYDYACDLELTTFVFTQGSFLSKKVLTIQKCIFSLSTGLSYYSIKNFQEILIFLKILY
jgi:hypothetical protein